MQARTRQTTHRSHEAKAVVGIVHMEMPIALRPVHIDTSNHMTPNSPAAMNHEQWGAELASILAVGVIRQLEQRTQSSHARGLCGHMLRRRRAKRCAGAGCGNQLGDGGSSKRLLDHGHGVVEPPVQRAQHAAV